MGRLFINKKGRYSHPKSFCLFYLFIHSFGSSLRGTTTIWDDIIFAKKGRFCRPKMYLGAKKKKKKKCSSLHIFQIFSGKNLPKPAYL